MKRIIALMLALLMTVSFVGCNDETGSAEPTKPENPVILKSEHYTVTTAEFQYYVAKIYDEFLTQNGAEIMSQIIKPDQPLRSQPCPAGKDMSWFDFFAESAMLNVKNYLWMAEQAYAEGYKAEGLQQQLDEQFADMEQTAKESGYSSLDEYLSNNYGSLSTKETLTNAFTISYIANNFRAEKYASYTLTDEDYQSYADKNKENCYVADFMFVNITSYIEEGDTAEVKAQKWAKCKETAKEFNNAITDKQSFFTLAEQYFLSTGKVVESGADSSKNEINKSDLPDAVKRTEIIGTAYDKGAPNVDWIFADGRIAGEHTIIEDEENYCCEIIYMLKPAYLTETGVVDVRHLLISKSEAGDAYKARTEAQRLYDLWKSGEATEDSFADMAIENTDDGGSRSSGGLYAAVEPGKMVAEFDAWIFDPARKSGDSALVDTTYGTHIMYFVKHGLPKWKSAADTGIREERTTAYAAELEKKYPLEIHEDNIDEVPDLLGQ